MVEGREVREAGEKTATHGSKAITISWYPLVGHLYELIDLDAYFPGYDPAVKQPWDLKKLPFFPDDWKFKFEGQGKSTGPYQGR